MPIPIIAALVAAGGAGGAAAVYKGLTSEAVTSRVGRIMEKLGPDFVQNAVDGIGLEMDVREGLTDENLTKVINRNFLASAGFQLDSVFDRKKMRDGLLREGLKRIMAGLDLPEETTIAGVTVKLQDFITAEAIVQLAQEAGDIFEAAKESKRIRKILEKQREDKTSYTRPRLMTQEAVKNRERQARYRAAHKRVWVAKQEAAAAAQGGGDGND